METCFEDATGLYVEVARERNAGNPEFRLPWIPPNLRELRLVEERWDELVHKSGTSWGDFLRILRNGPVLVWWSRRMFIVGDMPGRTGLARGSGFTLRAYFALNDPVQGVFVCFDGSAASLEGFFQFLAIQPSGHISVRSCDADFEVDHPDLDEDEPRGPRELQLPAASLAHFLDLYQIHQSIEFYLVDFSENQCQELSVFRGTLRFDECRFPDGASSLLEQVAANNGPGGLVFFEAAMNMNFPALQNALAVTKTLKSFELAYLPVNLQRFLDGLSRNQSLIELTFRAAEDDHFGDDEWILLFHTLQSHPTLKKVTVDVRAQTPFPDYRNNEEDRVRRTQVIIDMLRVNKVVCAITVHPDNTVDTELRRRQIQPRLKMNLFRDRVAAVVAVRDKRLRRRLFGAAITHRDVFEDPVIMWMFVRTLPDVISELREEMELALAADGPPDAS